MRHLTKSTLTILLLFFISQLIGLVIVTQFIDHEKTALAGKAIFKEYPLDLLVFALIAVLTIVVPFIYGAKTINVWKLYFFFAVLLCLTIAFGLFINEYIALLLAAVLSVLAVYKQDILIHNITEIIVPGGIVVIFIPLLEFLNIFNVPVFAGFLIVISLIDIAFVFRKESGKKFARFLFKSEMIAAAVAPHKKEKNVKAAVLKGGSSFIGLGDFVSPLFFTSVVMKELVLREAFLTAFLKTLIIPLLGAVALSVLALKSDKYMYYPAMPFISIGCFVGYGIIWLIGI